MFQQLLFGTHNCKLLWRHAAYLNLEYDDTFLWLRIVSSIITPRIKIQELSPHSPGYWLVLKKVNNFIIFFIAIIVHSKPWLLHLAGGSGFQSRCLSLNCSKRVFTSRLIASSFFTFFFSYSLKKIRIPCNEKAGFQNTELLYSLASKQPPPTAHQ